jgi:hypothetical protein
VHHFRSAAALAASLIAKAISAGRKAGFAQDVRIGDFPFPRDGARLHYSRWIAGDSASDGFSKNLNS